MTNPEDAYDRLALHLGLTDDADEAADHAGLSAPTAEWSADRNRLIITSPTTFEGETQHFAARTQSFALQPRRGVVLNCTRALVASRRSDR